MISTVDKGIEYDCYIIQENNLLTNKMDDQIWKIARNLEDRNFEYIVLNFLKDAQIPYFNRDNVLTAEQFIDVSENYGEIIKLKPLLNNFFGVTFEYALHDVRAPAEPEQFDSIIATLSPTVWPYFNYDLYNDRLIIEANGYLHR